MTKHYMALITPEVLLWARERINMPLAVAAKKLDVDEERLAAWERGAEYPSISKAKEIAHLYRRPLAFFYLPKPPDALDRLTDYRRLAATSAGQMSTGLLQEIERAEYLRSIALKLLPADKTEFKLLDSVSIEDDPERVGEHIRTILGVTFDDQSGWKGDKRIAFLHWQAVIERTHVLVLQTTHQAGEGFPLDEARGFSIGEPVLPVIMVNAKDEYGGRIFTLLHEFAHLLLDATGICDLREVYRPKTMEQRIEIFCNRVAAAALVPKAALLDQVVVTQHQVEEDWTDEEIDSVARNFAVSSEAIARRLTTFALASEAFYARKHAEYEQIYADLRSKRRPGQVPYRHMVIRRNSVALTRLVFEAYYEDRITLSKLAAYLNISLKTLDSVERAAFAGVGID